MSLLPLETDLHAFATAVRSTTELLFSSLLCTSYVLEVMRTGLPADCWETRQEINNVKVTSLSLAECQCLLHQACVPLVYSEILAAFVLSVTRGASQDANSAGEILHYLLSPRRSSVYLKLNEPARLMP